MLENSNARKLDKQIQLKKNLIGMPIEIKSIKGYYYLDAWVMSHIVYQATISFAQRYLNKTNDPCGRLYDQMVMAARSAPANIAEGSSRRQTSRETEMRPSLSSRPCHPVTTTRWHFFHLQFAKSPKKHYLCPNILEAAQS